MRSLLLVTVSMLILPSGRAIAAWSSDAATNQPVANATGDQVQPHLVPTSTGGVYVSWFDALGNGFDVRVQALDADGNEIFPDEGVLVADRGFSSTQDYGLGVDATDHALLAFRDDRFGDVQITAARVADDGTLVWGTNGIQVTATTAFVAAPRVVGTSDGGIVVAWTEDATSRVQKLDADGAVQWGSGVTFTPTTGSYSVSDLRADGGDVIVSIVHQTGGFGSPRLLVAQKLNASGSPLWGADPVVVFDSGSLQFGNFPEFEGDGQGGAVFSWYDAGSLQLQCYVQHLDADGLELFPHNGVAVSTDMTRVRVSPSVAVDTGTNRVWAFWEEQSSNQAQSGVYGQLLDTDGTRLWGANGVEVVAVSSNDVNMVRAVALPTGPFAFWSSAPSFGADRLFGARLDGTGTIDVGPFDVSSTPSGKSRLAIVATGGQAVLAWSDDRVDAGDILVQNVRGDGSLGGETIDVADSAPAVAIGAPWPNPFRASVRIPIGSVHSATSVDVYDVTGRLVRALDVPAGFREATWDGRDDAGRLVAPGRYFVRLGDDRLAVSVSRVH